LPVLARAYWHPAPLPPSHPAPQALDKAKDVAEGMQKAAEGKPQ
jgi:hypothetical protein